MDDLTPIEKSWAQSMACSPGQCLDGGQLLEIAERGKRAPEYASRMAHIAVCPACRGTLKILNLAEAARPRRNFLLALPAPGYLLAAGLATAALMLAVWMGMQLGSKDTPQIAGQHEIRQPGPNREPLSPRKKDPGLIAKSNIPAPENASPVGRKRSPVVLRKPEPNPPLPPQKGARSPERTIIAGNPEPGVLEGTVIYTQILEGEVSQSHFLEGEVHSSATVEGEVIRKAPPPGGGTVLQP